MSGDAQSLLSDSHDESGVFADSIDLIPRIERSEVIRPHDRDIIDEPDAAAVMTVESGSEAQGSWGWEMTRVGDCRKRTGRIAAGRTSFPRGTLRGASGREVYFLPCRISSRFIG